MEKPEDDITAFRALLRQQLLQVQQQVRQLKALKNHLAQLLSRMDGPAMPRAQHMAMGSTAAPGQGISWSEVQWHLWWRCGWLPLDMSGDPWPEYRHLCDGQAYLA
ncbi:hypothetical protein J2Y68_003381 [Paenarthrobacter nitroguajacolicus]|nr:hypothetical protein [Paenarthrobacter nitroguajacolicus]